MYNLGSSELGSILGKMVQPNHCLLDGSLGPETDMDKSKAIQQVSGRART